jgi:hypothetical protein
MNCANIMEQRHCQFLLSMLSHISFELLPDQSDATKAEMHGLPLYSTDHVQRDLAVTIASDLAAISQYVAVPPPS